MKGLCTRCRFHFVCRMLPLDDSYPDWQEWAIEIVSESAWYAFTSSTDDLGVDGPTTCNPYCPPHSHSLLCMASGSCIYCMNITGYCKYACLFLPVIKRGISNSLHELTFTLATWCLFDEGKSSWDRTPILVVFLVVCSWFCWLCMSSRHLMSSPKACSQNKFLYPHTMLKINVSANGVQGQDDPILTDLYGDKCNLKVLLFQGLEWNS